MTKRIGMFCALALVILMTGACEKVSNPLAPSNPGGGATASEFGIDRDSISVKADGDQVGQKFFYMAREFVATGSASYPAGTDLAQLWVKIGLVPDMASYEVVPFLEEYRQAGYIMTTSWSGNIWTVTWKNAMPISSCNGKVFCEPFKMPKIGKGITFQLQTGTPFTASAGVGSVVTLDLALQYGPKPEVLPATK